MDNFLVQKLLEHMMQKENIHDSMRPFVERASLNFNSGQISDMEFIKNETAVVLSRITIEVVEEEINTGVPPLDDITEAISNKLVKEPIYTKILDLCSSGADLFKLLKTTIELGEGTTVGQLLHAQALVTVALEEMTSRRPDEGAEENENMFDGGLGMGGFSLN